MSKHDWKGITKEDVKKAIQLFLAENPECPAPRSTFLIYEGKKLPAKHIRGMAYKVAYNEDISKDEYAGGMETVRFFERLGFEMYYIKTSSQSQTAKNQREVEKNKPKIEEKKTTYNGVLETNLIRNPERPDDRIRITSRDVIEQKNALQLILNKMFHGDVVCEKTFNWLKTPSEITDDYLKIYNLLKEYRGNCDFAKKNITLRCDFVCEGEKLIIEYDERQHFSEARRISLKAYEDVKVCYDRKLWIKACKDIQAKDGQPVNRDEIRAYYDSTRDIEAEKHGYRLVRIMHGQIDFNASDAETKLKEYLEESLNNKRKNLKIGMYLQSDQWKNERDFYKAIGRVKKSDIDLLVFPEFCFVPFEKLMVNADISSEKDSEEIYNACLKLSEEINKAVVVSSYDKYGTIYSIFANSHARTKETKLATYIKHTMTQYSAFEFENYPELAESLFSPIDFKGYRIGLTICYDCNHAIFSRMYGVQGVDIIINSTGGDVVYDKWHKYNQARAIENKCYTFVTMGGDGNKKNPNSYVFGFNPNGKELHPKLLNGKSESTNQPGEIYVYELAMDDNGEEPESSIDQDQTLNKYQQLFIPVGNVEDILNKSVKIERGLYVYPYKDVNVVFIVVEDNKIFQVESFLPQMYSDRIKKYPNRRYIVVNKYKNLDERLYENKLSLILKVRAMENFCAVILESNILNRCYQSGKSKTAQVVKEENGLYGLDLSRMSGPEAIWKNKGDTFKAAWRKNYEWLVKKCKLVSETGV